MHQSEYEAVVKGYLGALADGYRISPDSVLHAARGLRYSGDDPIRVTFGLDEYASRLGQLDAMKNLRSLIHKEWMDDE